MISWAVALSATLGFLVVAVLLLHRLWRHGIELVTSVLSFHLILIGLPFVSFGWAVASSGSIQPLVRRNIDTWFVLPTVVSGRALWIALFFEVVLLGSLLGFRRWKTSRSHGSSPVPVAQIDPDRYRQLALAIGFGAISYMLLRLVIVGDFPLWTVLDGRDTRLRDRSFAFATNLDVPYVFRASITRLIIRYALPLAWLMLWSYRKFEKRDDAAFFEFVFGLLVFVFALGSIKRSSLVLLAAWLLILIMGYGRIRIRLVAATGAAALVIVTALTFVYSVSAGHRRVAVLRGGYQRISFDEAIFEWVAFENFGPNVDFLGFQPIQWQVQKLLGGSGQTFGSYWKLTTLGPESRGWSSIGYAGELWAIGGWLVLCIGTVIFGLGLAALNERFRLLWQQPLFRPVLAGFILSMSATSIKGLMTQALGGGLIALALALLVTSRFAGRPSPLPTSVESSADPSADPSDEVMV